VEAQNVSRVKSVNVIQIYILYPVHKCISTFTM